ncbi:MAG TPA: TrkA family potassium uptake protein [Dehalococcoidia bacterium]|nr:TrkA family potassium uptake protein [Dehalococcoidia bacterium]
MRVLIMGCGRVGALLASMLDESGHEVTVLDMDEQAFRRLKPGFKGTRMTGNGIDEDVLRRADIENVDAFLALTQGDNRNIMSAQIAKHIFRVPRVICRIYDPQRDSIFRELGIETISPTTVGARILEQQLVGAAAQPEA